MTDYGAMDVYDLCEAVGTRLGYHVLGERDKFVLIFPNGDPYRKHRDTEREAWEDSPNWPRWPDAAFELSLPEGFTITKVPDGWRAWVGNPDRFPFVRPKVAEAVSCGWLACHDAGAGQ